MEKDWTGNSHSFASMLGARNYAKNEREQHDFYATDPKAIDMLLTKDFTVYYAFWRLLFNRLV